MEWSEREEERLVRLATIGDLTAFDALVSHYRPATVALARQIVAGRETAEDVAQDALITAYKALPQLKQVERFGSWLAAIVRHRARRVAQARDEQMERLDEFLAERIPSLREASAFNEIACEIARLPEEVRLPAELFFLREWSMEQIGSFLELPLTTVKWRLHTARKLLRPRLASWRNDQ